MSQLTDVESELRRLAKALRAEEGALDDEALACELAADIVAKSGRQSAALRNLVKCWRGKTVPCRQCADELEAALQ